MFLFYHYYKVSHLKNYSIILKIHSIQSHVQFINVNYLLHLSISTYMNQL